MQCREAAVGGMRDPSGRNAGSESEKPGSTEGI